MTVYGQTVIFPLLSLLTISRMVFSCDVNDKLSLYSW